MGRKAKDPEVRRKEIVEAAEQLFTEKGFDQTSVSDITGRVGLSHGAFFYYFKSKNDLFKSVVRNYLDKEVEGFRAFVDDNRVDALKKIQLLVDRSLSSSQVKNGFIDYMHYEGNASIHDEYTRRSQELLIPMIAEVVQQGVDEGLFNVEYPRECVELIIPMFDSMYHSLQQPQGNDEYYRRLRALESILTRCLGIKEGSLTVRPMR